MRDLGLSFEALVRSTADLHLRFGTQQTLSEALLCFDEEVHEFEAEAVSASRMAYPLTEEAVDVIVTLLGVLRADERDVVLAAICDALRRMEGREAGR